MCRNFFDGTSIQELLEDFQCMVVQICGTWAWEIISFTGSVSVLGGLGLRSVLWLHSSLVLFNVGGLVRFLIGNFGWRSVLMVDYFMLVLCATKPGETGA